MKIARFGDTWAGGLVLDDLKAADSWKAERPPVVTQAGSAGGAFDFYGDDNFPISPLVVRKNYHVSASTYTGVETNVNILRANSIAAGRSRLWGLWRDGTTRVWAWAKCVAGPGANEVFGSRYTTMPVELQFYCPEGLWYAETDGSYTAGGTSDVTNSGNVNALLKLTMTCNTAAITFSTDADTQVQVAGGGAVQNEVTFGINGETLNPAETIILNSRSYRVLFAGADDYANLTVGSGQIAWLWIPSGTWRVSTTVAYGGAGTLTYDYSWRHTYIF